MIHVLVLGSIEWEFPIKHGASTFCCWGPVVQPRLVCRCVYIRIHTKPHVIFLLSWYISSYFIFCCVFLWSNDQNTVFSLLIFLLHCISSSNSYYLSDSFYFYHPKESQRFRCWLIVYSSDHMQLGGANSLLPNSEHTVSPMILNILHKEQNQVSLASF